MAETLTDAQRQVLLALPRHAESNWWGTAPNKLSRSARDALVRKGLVEMRRQPSGDCYKLTRDGELARTRLEAEMSEKFTGAEMRVLQALPLSVESRLWGVGRGKLSSSVRDALIGKGLVEIFRDPLGEKYNAFHLTEAGRSARGPLPHKKADRVRTGDGDA